MKKLLLVAVLGGLLGAGLVHWLCPPVVRTVYRFHTAAEEQEFRRAVAADRQAVRDEMAAWKKGMPIR